MKNNGFVFVETIIAIVVLTSALLLLYSTFNKVLQLEKTRVYYDDISYIYRSLNIKNELSNLNLMPALKDLTNNDENYFITIGIETEELFSGHEHKKTFISKLLQDFEVNQMIVVKENKIDNLKKCTLECSLNNSCADYERCNRLYTNLSDEMINYLDTLYIDVSATYVLVVEYRTCSSDNTNCKNYYSWVSV